MAKYSPKEIQHLLDNLDALDVLELIDYHPESIRREGNIVYSYCPLCQDKSDRYLQVDLVTKEFRSSPPDIPEQTGNLIDLYARARRMNLNNAVEKLADEFGIMLMDALKDQNTDVVVREATTMVHKAAADGSDSSHTMLNEAEKRFYRALRSDPENREALEGIFQVRLQEKEPLALAEAAKRLIALDRKQGRLDHLVEVARKHLEVHPLDLEIRGHLAEAYEAQENPTAAFTEWMMLGSNAEESGMAGEALNAYRRARRVTRHGREAQQRIQNLILRTGKKADVIREIQERVAELKAEKRYQDASVEAAEALRFNPDDDDVRIQVIELTILAGLDEETMVRCLAMVEEMRIAGRVERAAEALSYLSAERPDDLDILLKLIGIYKQLGQEEVVEGLELRHAEALVAGKEYDKASDILVRRIENNREDGAALELLAEVRLEQGNTAAALDHLHEAVEVHLTMMDEERALEVVQKICQIDDTLWGDREREIDLLWAFGRREASEEKLVRLVEALTAAGEDERVVETLENHLRRDPGHLAAIKRLFRFACERDMEAKRAEIVERVLARLEDEGASQEIEELIEDFLTVDGDNTALHEALVRICLEAERKSDARERLLLLAAAHRRAGRATERADLYRDMEGLFPGDVEVLRNLVEACAEAGDEHGSVEAAEKLAALLVTGSQHREALALVNEVLKTRPESIPMLEALATINEKLGKKQEELSAKERLATAYTATGQKESALRILRELMVRDSQRIETVERLVDLLAEMENQQEVLPLCRRHIDLARDDRQRSIELLTGVLQRLPRFLELRLLLTELLRKSGRRDEMAAEMQATIEILEESEDRPKLVELYLQLLGIRPDNQNARRRLIELLRAEARSAELVEQQMLLAEQLREGDDLAAADEVYQRIYQDVGEDEEVLRAHASLLSDMGKGTEAQEKLRQLATHLGQRGRRDEAIEMLRSVLEDDPTDNASRRNLVEMLRQGQRLEEAGVELSALASMLSDQGDTRGAIATRREAIGVLPNSTELRQALIEELDGAGLSTEARAEQLGLAEMLSRQGQPQKALGMIDDLLQRSPNSLAPRQLRAQIYDSMGDEKRALAEYREMQRFTDKPAVMAVAAPTAVAEPEEDEFPGLQVLPEYDFENFIVGGRNNFAYATAKAVANNPGRAHNPLFLYSDVGLGKTHLLHAIANTLRARQPDIRIVYTSTEYFTSALIDAIQKNTVTQFRNRHRRADLLLLDDVQFLAGKERSQEEFFHIFNLLHQDGRQIVVTSDRPPKDIAHLDMRIRTRFGQGVIVDIQSPDVETRMAILRAEAERRGLDVSNEAITIIAERVSSNVRELKGAFNQLIAQHELCGDPLSGETALRIVDKFFAT